MTAVVAAVALTGCSGATTPEPTTPPSSTASAGAQTPPEQASPSPSTTPGGITADEAGTIVTDKYGGTVLDVEPDTHDGHATWEVEVADSNKGRIEVDVRRDTGEMVSFEQD